MSTKDILKEKAEQKSMEMMVSRYVNYIHKDPESNIDDAIDSMRQMEERTGDTKYLSNFADWLETHGGSKQWFINLFYRDKEIVKKFFLNFIINVNMKWLKQSREVRDELGGFAPPYTILISPTMRCNLRCTGCYAGNYTAEDDLSMEEVDRIIKEGKSLGTYFYTILGGEPFIKWDELSRIIRKHDDCLFQLFTNGTLIDEKVADEIRSLSNVYPVLSVNGWEEETDMTRGRGSFQKIVDVAGLLAERGVIFGNSFVFMRNNFDTLTSDALYDFWIEKGAFYGWTFLYMPVGENPEFDLMPTPRQRKAMGDYVRNLRERKPYFLMDFWNDAPSTGGCIAGGRRYLHINHRGDVEPCIFAHFATDNIHGKSLREVLCSPFFTDIKLHQPHSDNLLTPCMIIDNPHVLREIVRRHEPETTDGSSRKLVDEYSERLDRYAEAVHNTLDPVWEEKYPYLIREMETGQAFHTGELDRLVLQREPETAARVARDHPFVESCGFMENCGQHAFANEEAVPENRN